MSNNTGWISVEGIETSEASARRRRVQIKVVARWVVWGFVVWSFWTGRETLASLVIVMDLLLYHQIPPSIPPSRSSPKWALWTALGCLAVAWWISQRPWAVANLATMEVLMWTLVAVAALIVLLIDVRKLLDPATYYQVCAETIDEIEDLMMHLDVADESFDAPDSP
jgi:hypothetical protein